MSAEETIGIDAADDVIDLLARRIVSRHGGFDVHRSETWNWVVTVWCGRRQQSFRDERLARAMLAAQLWTPLPQVPREPMVYTMSGFVSRKAGNHWRVDYAGRDCCVRLETKKAMMSFAEKCVARSEQHREEWIRDYGWTLERTEGVDFEYED